VKGIPNGVLRRIIVDGRIIPEVGYVSRNPVAFEKDVGFVTGAVRLSIKRACGKGVIDRDDIFVDRWRNGAGRGGHSPVRSHDSPETATMPHLSPCYFFLFYECANFQDRRLCCNYQRNPL
jgi:hypothetical protein